MYLTAKAAGTTAILDRRSPPVVIGASGAGLWAQVRQYFAAWVEHLLTGPDHIVLLMMLILPAASPLLLRPPTELITALVALSIILTAADNLHPFLPGPRAASVAFFGLIHGCGFATVLTGTGLTGLSFVTALASFNLGIEAAQVMVVAGTVFALHALRGGRVLLVGGAVCWGCGGCGGCGGRCPPLPDRLRGPMPGDDAGERAPIP